jgi:hypothetical protein
MTVPAERLQAARELVDNVIAGRVTPDSDPAVFNDDLLYMAVGMLEQLDQAWLYERFDDDDAAAERLTHVANCLTGEQAEAIRLRVRGR